MVTTRGRNLATKGWGTVATTAVGLGPLGAFLFGNAKEALHDGRELYLLVEDPEWGFALPVHPTLGREVREFALAINRAAAKLPREPQAVDISTSVETALDVITQLERLTTLKQSGAITDAEFERLKLKLLD